MSALRARDGPVRVGDESGEREAPKHSVRWGMRERGRPGWRCGLSSFAPFDDGLPDKDTSGEKGGDEGWAGEDN
jgi:hypothetical protein